MNHFVTLPKPSSSGRWRGACGEGELGCEEAFCVFAAADASFEVFYDFVLGSCGAVEVVVDGGVEFDAEAIKLVVQSGDVLGEASRGVPRHVVLRFFVGRTAQLKRNKGVNK